MSHIYSVTELNQQIKGLLESTPSFRNVFVQGEISNYKLHTSGHHYLTLKDYGGAISAVLFRRDAVRLRFRPENGMKVIARGRISSFPKTGQVQLYLVDMTPDGAGALHLAFEQRKAQLLAEGLFDEMHKQSLPPMPQTIALVTSPTGAAVRDMLRILSRRFPLAQVQIWPVLVQGENAASDIARAIARVNAHGQADVMIVGRGGGSLEDLWAFNEEVVARAIYHSKIPIISAVGHEPDVTIADFVADLRAPTPSGAAELAVPDQRELWLQIDRVQARMTLILKRQLQLYRTGTEMLRTRLERHTPARYLHTKRQRILELFVRLKQCQMRRVERERLALSQTKQQLFQAPERLVAHRRAQLSACAGQLQALSPLQVLERGFSVVTNRNGQVISKSTMLGEGDRIQVRFAQGAVHARIETIEK